MDNNFVVTVMDVHQDNLMEIWPALVFSIKNASFIGIDCELSGLGRRNLINSQSVEERYKNIGEVARTRSIISIGLSCFKAAKGSAQGEPFHCDVQTFNLMTLCTEDYVVEPPALQFLVNHGFDFHKQYSSGIPYYRGCDKEEGRPKKKKTWDLRDIFSVLVASKVPLVVHNGLVDLIFLYGSLYADLPAALPTFVADLEQMFPAGIYDSKYIAEFSLRTSASFLEFVFRRQQIRNLSARGGKAVTLTHSLAVSAFVDAWDCSARLQCDQQTPICSPYSSHGFCPEGTKCSKSHDVVRAVIQEEQKKGRKRKLESGGGPILDELKSGIDSALQQPTSERFKGHRAGHDAFMTAFCFATFVAGRLSQDGDVEERIRKAADSVRNRICLSGKDFPFLIQKSAFSKCSKTHTEKLKRILEREEAS